MKPNVPLSHGTDNPVTQKSRKSVEPTLPSMYSPPKTRARARGLLAPQTVLPGIDEVTHHQLIYFDEYDPAEADVNNPHAWLEGLEDLEKGDFEAQVNFARPKYFVHAAKKVGKIRYQRSKGAHPEDPTTLTEVLATTEVKEWLNAIDTELNGLKENQVYEVRNMPVGRKAIPSRLIFKIKCGSNKEILKLKARVVVQGFRQRAGINYKETYAPVANSTVVRLAMAIGAHTDLEIEHVDFTQAFFKAPIEEEIYVSPPPGAPPLPPGQAWFLLRALYGCMQSPLAWHKTIHKHLLGAGFHDAGFEGTVYVRKTETSYFLLVLYVDDLLIFYDNANECVEFKKYLADRYKCTDEGNLSWHFGISYMRDRPAKKIFCDQRQNIKDMIARFNMEGCSPKATPMIQSARLTSDDCPENADEEVRTWYQEVVGSIRYVADCTQPDMALTAGELARFAQNPGPSHVEAAKRALRYLSGTVHWQLEFDG